MAQSEMTRIRELPIHDGEAYTGDSPFNPMYSDWVIDFDEQTTVPVISGLHIEKFAANHIVDWGGRGVYRLVDNLNHLFGGYNLNVLLGRMVPISKVEREVIAGFFHDTNSGHMVIAYKAEELYERLQERTIKYPNIGEKAIALFGDFNDRGLHKTQSI
jgi:hypothetical protein